MSANATTVMDPERVIANVVEEALGRRPLILCGSRATGEAEEGSDYDLLVVVPAAKIPFILRRIGRTAERLQRELGLPVSINPLPSVRLRRPGRSLLPWKVRFEGKVLSAPPGFQLARPAIPGPVIATGGMRFSYAVSGLHFLIRDLAPEELALRSLPVRLERGVRKALRHAVQLTLLRTGRYASSLEGALSMLGKAEGAGFRRLAERCDRPKTWFDTRDLLLGETGEHIPGGVGTFLRNLQYAVLSGMRRRGLRARALIERRPVGLRLERTVALLARTVGPRGLIDREVLAAARAELPVFLHPRDATWTALRDAVEREWPEANPLLGL